MRKFFRNKGLIAQITISIACILIIPTAVTCGFYYHLYNESLIKEADDELHNNLRIMTDRMDNNLDLISSVMNAIEYSQELSYFLDEKRNLSERERSYFQKSIQEQWINIRYSYPNMFYQMKIYSSNQQHEEVHDWKLAIYSLDDFPQYEKLPQIDGKIGYGYPHEGGNASSPRISQGVNVMNSDNYVFPAYLYVRNLNTGEIVGVVELDMFLEKLVEFRSLMAGSQGYKYLLLDSQGKILYQSGDFIGEELSDVQFFQEKDIEKVTVSGNTYRMLCDNSDETGFMRAAMISQSGVTQSVRDMIWKVGIVALLGITLIMILTYVLLKKLLNRLVVMDEVMARVETGDFAVVIEDDGYNDEVARIKRRFNQMTEKLHNVIQDTIEKEKAQKDAELRALQAQINPHFLYNTLETMRMQCEIDRYYKIGNALSALGNIFHYTIKWNNNLVPFIMEWNNLKNYIAIMNLRLDDDFSCNMECQDDVKHVMIPKMLLQPVAENSFQHGFKGSVPPWKLDVRAYRAEDCLRIIMEDNGSGIAQERLSEIQECIREGRSIMDCENKHQSIGLINVVQRIHMLCLPGSGLWIENLPEKGVRMEIKIMIKGDEPCTES